MSTYAPLPQPNEISTREREDAMGAYFMMFAALAAGLPLPIINIIAATIYYFINRKKSRFVHFHSLQSLLSQLPTSLLNAGLIIYTLNCFFDGLDFTDSYFGYLAMVITANIAYIVFSIIAAVKARKGYMFYFIFFGKLCYDVAFKVNPNETTPTENLVENKPPQ